MISFDFFELNVTFHLKAQFEIFAKSLFNFAAVSAESVPETNKEVSSAKNLYMLSGTF